MFAAAVLGLILDAGALMKILMFAVPALLIIFEAFLGVAINLRFPRFDWISETIAIKQSISTVIVMFSAMAVVVGGAALYIIVLNEKLAMELYLILFSILLAAASAGIYVFLKTKGSAAFAALHN